MKKISFFAIFASLFILTACNEDKCSNWGIEYDTTDTLVVSGESHIVPLVLRDVQRLDVVAVSDGWNAVVKDATLVVDAPNSVNDTNRHADVEFLAVCLCGEQQHYTLHFTAGVMSVLTFEDNDTHFAPYIIDGCGATISQWSDLIDNVQYGGALLYNNFEYTGYKWHDAGNTELASGIIDGGPYWNGGHVISNYYSTDYTATSYEKQLEVAVGSEGSAGNNGSHNFCVQNGYVDENSYKTTVPNFYFADGVPRIIKSMFVVNTAYTFNSLRNGDDFSVAASDDTWYKITATGYDADNNVTGTVDFYLCNGKDNIVCEWTEWSLASLGRVIKVEFNLSASDDLNGQFGLTVPTYFAYDDVTVIL